MEYKSRAELLGLPLVHVAMGGMVDGQSRRGIAKGWIAIGAISLGVIFSVGGIAVGGCAIGGLSLGVLTLAGLAIGVYACGGAALGVWSIGGLAAGVHAAFGGAAFAFDCAEGGLAVAKHANDAMANDYFKGEWFFIIAGKVLEHSRWFVLLALIPVVLAVRAKVRGNRTDVQCR